jgi:hypothetical protein
MAWGERLEMSRQWKGNATSQGKTLNWTWKQNWEGDNNHSSKVSHKLLDIDVEEKKEIKDQFKIFLLHNDGFINKSNTDKRMIKVGNHVKLTFD